MRFLVYDDSFEGLLTAIVFARDHELAQIEILPEKKAAGLLFGGDFIATDPEKADYLLRVFGHIAGSKALKPVFLTYLADDAPREKLLLNYIGLTLHEGRNVNGWLHHDTVAELMATARRVSREIHRLTGLLRFQELADGSFYAPFEPDHNVIIPLARHFSRRMPDRNWMLHDLRRRVGIFWDGRGFLPADISSGDNRLPLSEREKFFQSCWRSYHREISLKEKKNPKLQKQFMPLRYWKYLTEVS